MRPVGKQGEALAFSSPWVDGWGERWLGPDEREARSALACDEAVDLVDALRDGVLEGGA